MRAALEAVADPEIAEKDKRYHKYDGYEAYGIRSRPFNKVIRDLRDGLRALDIEERRKLAMRLVETGIEEEAGVAVWLLRNSVDDLGPDERDYFDAFTAGIRSWSTTDGFGTQVIKPLLQREPQPMLELLWGWNQSDERWKQRASVVAFTRSKDDAGQLLDETLEFCEQLIWSEDDLVRKGVGWALRDAMRADKELVLPYVTELRRRGVSSVITLYALRDIEGEERERVLAVKKP